MALSVELVYSSCRAAKRARKLSMQFTATKLCMMYVQELALYAGSPTDWNQKFAYIGKIKVSLLFCSGENTRNANGHRLSSCVVQRNILSAHRHNGFVPYICECVPYIMSVCSLY